MPRIRYDRPPEISVKPTIITGGEKTLGAAMRAAAVPAFIGAVIGGVIGVLLSLFAIIDLGISGLLSTLVLALGGIAIFGFLGFVWGLLDYAVPEAKTALGWIVVIVVIIGLAWAAITMYRAGTLPEYLKFASPVFETIQEGIKEMAEFRHCLTADPRCPLFPSFDDPNIQNVKEELSVDVSFDEKRIKPDDTVSLLVKLTVRNPELAELRIKPRCYFKSKEEEKGGREMIVERLGSYSYGNEFRFPSTTEFEKLNTQFYCYGEIPEAIDKNIYSEKIIIELERPVAVKTTWPVWIGSRPRRGIVRSSMAYNAPYTVSLASNNDMPFEEGKEYGFQVTIKRRVDDVKLKRVESIVIYVPEEMMAECEHFEGIEELEFREASYKALKEITQFDIEQDKFVFPCKLYIASAPAQSVLAPILLQSYYSVSSDYSTRIFKSP